MFDNDLLKRILAPNLLKATSVLVICRRTVSDVSKYCLLSVCDIPFKCKHPIGDALHDINIKMSGSNSKLLELSIYPDGSFKIKKVIHKEDLNNLPYTIKIRKEV